MIKFWFICLIFFANTPTLFAAPNTNHTAHTVKDFAYSASLSNANTSLREIEIPIALYENIKRKDYGDLRLFNADGQIVPHQFNHSTPHKNVYQSTPLVFYPLSQKEAQNTNNIQVIISQKSKESHLRVDQKFVENNPQEPNEYQYIIENKIDNKKHSPLLCQLKLNWTQSQPSSVIRFKLESSNQLQQWRTLSHNLTVSKLNYDGSQLIHNQVNFPCTSQKYLRLTWLQPSQSTQLSHIEGVYTYKQNNETRWINTGKPPIQKDGHWFFESPVIAAISSIEFIAPNDGLLYKGALYSRHNEKEKWRYRTEVNQYQLNLGETSLQSSPLTFSATSDRYWKMNLKTESQLSPNQLPDIKLGWIPKQLYFLAQGNEPFTIAFGNPNIKPAHNNGLNDLINSIKQSKANIDQVQIEAITSHNKTFKSNSELPWKQIVLWIVLILGTLLMGLMAYRLYQQMNEDKKQ